MLIFNIIEETYCMWMLTFRTLHIYIRSLSIHLNACNRKLANLYDLNYVFFIYSLPSYNISTDKTCRLEFSGGITTCWAALNKNAFFSVKIIKLFSIHLISILWKKLFYSCNIIIWPLVVKGYSPIDVKIIVSSFWNKVLHTSWFNIYGSMFSLIKNDRSYNVPPWI
jgi:hypothetical protein